MPFPFQQEADQIHFFPGGTVRPALHPLRLPPRRSEQPRFQDTDLCRAGAVVNAGKEKSNKGQTSLQKWEGKKKMTTIFFPEIY